MISAVAAATPVAFADEVVQFTNGAEMTVRSHAIEKDMVKLDLGGSSSITFPISMVDKIAAMKLERIGERIGALSTSQMVRVSDALRMWLELGNTE
jgi:mRNA-degrading endonuclease toxin of MazEF toxin-antitoxin module